MNSIERLDKLKSNIAHLDKLIDAEFRRLKTSNTTLKREDYQSYYKLTIRRNILVKKCILTYKQIAQFKESCTDKILYEARSLR